MQIYVLKCFQNFGGSVWWCSGKGERLGCERPGCEVWVRPWVAIFFLFIETLSIIKKGNLRHRRYSYGYGKTGSKKHATCLATLLQNEFNSDVARLTTHIKPVLKYNTLLTGLNVGKTGNNTFQLVLQQFCKTSCTFLLTVLPKLN